MSYRYLLPGTTYALGTTIIYGAGDTFSGNNTSYTVRGFTPNYLFKTVTNNDKKYHGVNYFGPFVGATASNNVRNIIQEQWPSNVTITYARQSIFPSLDGVQQATIISGGTVIQSSSALYGYSQSTLDQKVQFGGLGTSISGGVSLNSSSTVDVFNNQSYITGITIPVAGTTTSTTYSDSTVYYLNNFYYDNILAPFGLGSAPSGYFLQMAVANFPGSGTANINASGITFSDQLNNSLTVAFNGTSLIYNGGSITANTSLITYPTGTLATGGTGFNSSVMNNSFTARINAASANAYIDLTKLRTITFAAVGYNSLNYSLNVSNMKLVNSSYGNFGAGVQTKTGILQQEFWPNITQQSFPPIVQDTYTAYNYTHVVKFNSGHTPAYDMNYGDANYGGGIYGGQTNIALDYNQFSTYLRVNPNRKTATNDYIQIQLLSSLGNTQLYGWDGGTAGTQIFHEYGPALATTTDYVLLTYLYQNTIRAEIWSFSSGALNTLLFATNNYTTQTTSTQNSGGGYMGYSLAPNTGDFYIDYMYAKDIILSEYTSRTFNSALPVQSVSIFANTSAPDNLVSYQNITNPTGPPLNFFQEQPTTIDNLGTNIPEMGTSLTIYGQSSAVIDTTYVPPAAGPLGFNPNQTFNSSPYSYKVSKNIMNANIAGVNYISPIIVSNSRSLTIKGYLRYEAILDQTIQNSTDPTTNGKPGAFRIVLWDKYFKNILFIEEIQNLKPDQWNTFLVDIVADIYEPEIQIEIQHVGTSKTLNQWASFWINNIQVLYRGINWEASSNGGITWLPFYNNINSPYSGVRFPNDIYRYSVLEDNPAIYWKLDETSGTVATNYSSYGTINNGTYGGTSLITYKSPGITSIATDFLSYGKRFAGSSIPSTISLGSATGLVSTGVSAEAWIRTGTAINQTIVASVSKNLLSAVNSNFETGIGDWHPSGVVTQSNAQAYSGNYSLAFSGGNAASGNISAKPSQTYFVSAYIRASTVPRSCFIIIYSYDGSNWTQVATGNTATDSTTGWTQITATGTLLSNATAIAIQIQANSINEIHYIDNVSVTSQDGSWSLSTGGSALNSGGGTVTFGIVGVGTAIGLMNYFNDSEQTLFAPATANWNHLVGTYDGNNIDIYGNGTLLNRVYNSTMGTVVTNSGVTVIGPTSGYRYQDETSVYPYALTGQQVLRHYNAGVSSYNQLKIRARAYTEDSWIKNYEVTPHYAKPGRLLGS